MARKAKSKGKSRRRAVPKRRAKRAGRTAPRAAARARLSRDVVEEILVHSAKSDAGDRLSDKALSEIALCADLDPARVLAVHRRLCDAATDADVAVLRVIEIWDPEDAEE